MKVFYYCNFPSPYYIGFLDELGKKCDLTVVFERRSSSERDESWKSFAAPHVKNLYIMHGIHTRPDMAFCPQIIRYIRREKYDYIIIHDPASPTGMWLIWYMKMHKIPFILQSEGGFPGDGKSSLKERYKKALMSGAKLYLSTMSLERDYFLSYGATASNIKQYPFSSFYKKDILSKPLCQQEKKNLRKELGVREDKVIISVGRIIHKKAFDVLLYAIKDLTSDVGVYIVGGAASEDLKEIMEQYHIQNVHFVDFMPKEELWKWYQMADFLALPTRYDTWGLFVNEAMANGLPVITTKKSVAGLELIENGKTGFLIDVDDVNDLNNKIHTLLENDDLRIQMAYNCIRKIQTFTFEDSAQITYEALQALD